MQESGLETGRLEFLEKRDGRVAAATFAERTLRTYRRAVLSKRIPRRPRSCGPVAHAMSSEHRRSFISSYVAFKRYLIATRGGNRHVAINE